MFTTEQVLEMIPMIYYIKKKGLYAAVDDDGNYVDKLHMVPIPWREYPRYMFGKGMELIDLWKRKYNKKHLKTVKMKENSLNDREVVFHRTELEESGRAHLIHQVVYEKGEKKSEIKLNQEQIVKMRELLLEVLLNGKLEWDNKTYENNNMSTESLVYVALLKSPDYIISSKNLLDMGVEYRTANKSLESMVKQGKLKRCEKIGTKKFYTSTMPREKMLELYRPYPMEDE